jgi:WD40 repeat protein
MLLAVREQKTRATVAQARAEEQAHIATVQRFANDFWTASSADRNILFACELVKELSGRTESDPLGCGEAASILNLALDRRKRLVETHWNFKLPDADSKEVSRVPLYALAYSSDGQTLIAGDSEARVRVLRNGTLGEAIMVSGKQIRTIAFSSDNSKVAIGTSRGFVSILDLNPSDPTHAITQLEVPAGTNQVPVVWSCSWNQEGDLAAAAQDGTVYIWSDLWHSLRSGIVPPPLQLKNSAPVFAVAWDHGGSLLAIGDAEGNFRLWNKTALSEPTKAHLSAIWGLAWSQDGRLACASWDCSISVWKADYLSTMQPPTCLQVKLHAHSYWVRDVVWIDEDRTIASAGDDGTIRFWRSSDLDELGSEPTPTQALWKLSYSSILKMFAAACNDGAIRIYQFNPPRTDTHGNHRNTIICLAFGRSSVLSFDQEGGVEDFDPTSRADNSFQIPSKFKSGIQSVCFYPQREAFVIGYAQSFQGDKQHGELAVWSPHVDEVKCCSTEESVGYIACHPTQSIVAFVTKSGAIGFKSLPELQAISGLQDLQPIPKASAERLERILSWSPAGDKLLIATVPDVGDSQIRIFRFDDKGLTVVNAFPVPVPLTCVQWHPSEALVALGTKDGRIIVQPIDGSKVFPISAHDKSVKTLNWSADGHHLFTGGEDGTINLWDYTPDGNKLALVVTLRLPSGAVYAAGLSRDGKVLYTAGNSSTVFHWLVGDYTLDSILARAQKMVHRNMFKSEWDRYARGSVPKYHPYVKTFDALPALYLLKSP